MKKILILFTATALLGMSLSLEAATVVWEDGMESLDPWTEASRADPEEGDSVGGIQVVGGWMIQMNSWWGTNPSGQNAGWTNMWTNTGVVIQPGTEYTLTFRMVSYANEKAVTINLSGVDSATWTNFDSPSISPATSWGNYTVSFSTVGGENNAVVGQELGVGISPGWWNNLGISTVTIELESSVLTAHNPSPTPDEDVDDNLNEVGTIGDAGVDVQLGWTTGRDPEDDPNYVSINPNITAHYLYVRENEPNFVDVTPEVIDEGMVGETASVLLEDLPYGSVFYWRVDESVNSSSPSDPNTIAGATWAFETIQEVPNILTDPKDSLVADGETAVFEIEATSPTTMLYDWYLSADKVLDTFVDTHLGQTTEADPNLYYTASLADAGKFVFCEVSNAGSLTSVSQPALMEVERLIGHWKMDDNLNDSSGYGWNGTYTTAPVVYDGAGKDGSALSLLNEPNHVQISGSEDAFNFFHLGLTVNCWIKTDKIWSGLVCKQDRTGYDPYNGFIFEINGSGQVNLGYRGVGGPVGSTAVNDGQWHMVTGTFDGDTGEMVIYVDGEEDAVGTYPNAVVRQADNPLVIGAEEVAGTTVLEGLIDDVRVYTYAKTDTEVLDLYNELTDPDKILCLLDYMSSADISGPTGEPDCKVDLNDFAEIASGWLTCGLYPTCP